MTQSKLAERNGCSEAAITQFKARHQQEIAAIRDNAEDEYAGILLASKVNRLSTYQEMVERAEDRGDDRMAAKLLRQMAEELGALPQRMQVSGQLDTTTRYTVDGVDMEALR